MKRTISSLTISLALGVGVGAGIGACDSGSAARAPTGGGGDTPGLEGGPASWPDEEFRAAKPAPRPVADVELPTIERFELDNGIEVFLVRQDRLPTVRMSLEFEGGGARDPRGKAGLSSVCMELWGEGTRKLDKVAFEERQADLAANVGASSGEESVELSARSLVPQLGPTLNLLAEMIREPGLREEDFERVVNRRVAGVTQQRASTDGIAGRLFSGLVWGPKHPYSQVVTEKSLRAVSLADCRKLVAGVRPDGAKLWIVGKVDQALVREQVGTKLAFWKGKAAAAKPVAAAKPPNGAIHFVQVDGAVQSMVIVGHPGPLRSAADYEATYLMAQILGGSFSSRINMNLREGKGYSYGGRGGFAYRRGGSHFQASSSVETTTTALALREIATEIAAMRAAPPTSVELAREQEGALLAVPGQFSTPTETLATLRELDEFGLPLDWHAGHQQRLRAADAASVHAAAVSHLSDGPFVVLVVGDGGATAKGSEKTVLEQLRALADEKVFGDGGLVLLDADGLRLREPK